MSILRAAHAVAAVEAAVAGSVSDTDAAADVTCRGIVLEVVELLVELQTIELAQRRQRDQRWGPRTIDLDILLFDNLQVATESLTLPHPGLHQRDFVLYPLSNIDDSLEIPGRGMLKELIERCPENGLQYLGAIEGNKA